MEIVTWEGVRSCVINGMRAGTSNCLAPGTFIPKNKKATGFIPIAFFKIVRCELTDLDHHVGSKRVANAVQYVTFLHLFIRKAFALIHVHFSAQAFTAASRT